jgi:hypothetical protein
MRKSFKIESTRTTAEKNTFAANYPELAELVSGTWVAPGLRTRFVPQGITLLPGNRQFAMTFHDPSKTRPSRLVVVDARRRGTVVKDVDLEDDDGDAYTGHAGGLTVHGRHLWISSWGRVLRFDLKDVRRSSPTPLRASGHFLPDSKGSFTSSDGTFLWVGEFAHPKHGYEVASHHRCPCDPEKIAWVAGYRIGANGQPTSRGRYDVGGATVVRPDRVLFIRQKVQGMALVKGVVALSLSFGSTDSKLAFYRSPFSGKGFEVELPRGVTKGFVVNAENHLGTVAMPAGSQGIEWNGRGLLVGFEGGCDKYRERWRAEGGGIEDRVLELRVPRLGWFDHRG